MAGTITALVVQKRNKQRVNVELDGEFAFGLSLIKAAELRKGQQLTDADIETLRHEDSAEVAYERALNFLAYRPRSEREVRRNLAKKDPDMPEDTLDEVIARLERAGLLDDAEFARYWVANRQEFKPRSIRALSYELQQKGVARQHIDAAVAEVDEFEAATQAAEKRARRLARLDHDLFYKRLGDFLSRRGFAYDVIREVVDAMWNTVAQARESD